MRQGFFVSKTWGAVKHIFLGWLADYYSFQFRLLTFSVFMAAKRPDLKSEVM
jgi:hypothetical protein